MEEMITIKKSEYEKLLAASQKLRALETHGVNNWEGYDNAMETLEKAEQFWKE